jgi:transposase
VREGTIEATREALSALVASMPQRWSAGLEATMFSAWIYDHIRAPGGTVKVAQSTILKAIAAGKRKNDRLDARKIADLLRCDYFPECHMAAPEIRNRRRVLRCRNLLVRQAVRMKTKVSGLLMETGIPYNKTKLHSKKYFYQLLEERRVAALLDFTSHIQPIRFRQLRHTTQVMRRCGFKKLSLAAIHG